MPTKLILACYDDLLQEMANQTNALVGACEAKDTKVMSDAKKRVDYLYELATKAIDRSRKTIIRH